jgi:dolichol-phosphate mannosyltransferase
MRKKSKLISIVIPCFNEEALIQTTINRLIFFRRKIKTLNIELIFIDDGSEDTTFEHLKTNAKIHANFKVISFSRNFGHQIAVTAGINAASGDAVVLIDSDMQDPPEVIHKMIKLWEEGYQVVYGTRIQRAGETYFKTLSAKYFYKLLNHLSDVKIPMDTGDFRLMDRTVVEVLKSMPEQDRFIRGMVSWAGYNQISIKYNRDPRIAGISKYPLKKMIKFAADGILSFSTKPLHISVAFGFICAIFALIGIVYALCIRLFTDTWVPGWAGIIITVLFIGGVQLICLGILGGYIGRIYNETKKRPLYVVKEEIN